MKLNNYIVRHSFISSILILSLACAPSITLGLGWAEMGIIIFLGIFLFGPLIFGLMRRLTRFKDDNDHR